MHSKVNYRESKVDWELLFLLLEYVEVLKKAKVHPKGNYKQLKVI